jgi:hypothetical protein
MARTAIPVEDIILGGLVASYTTGDATNDHEFRNDRGDLILHVVNGGGSACVVDIITPFTRAGLALDDAGGSVANATDRFFGPFDPAVFNTSTGLVEVDIDQDASVTLAVLRLPSF